MPLNKLLSQMSVPLSGGGGGGGQTEPPKLPFKTVWPTFNSLLIVSEKAEKQRIANYLHYKYGQSVTMQNKTLHLKPGNILKVYSL